MIQKTNAMNFTIKPLLIAAMCTVAFKASSQVTLNATSGTASAGYSTLSAAFTAINNGTHQGNITIKIHSSITETANSLLNGSGTGAAVYTSIKILPADTATAEKTISISTSGVTLISFSATKNLTIDGRPNETGTSKLLTISNPNSTAASHVVLFTGGASGNAIRYCSLKSASSGTTAASVVRFTTGANSNNSISNCRIEGGNLGVEINGTNGTPNNYNTIDNNLFIDQKATGVRLTAGVGNTNISNNSFTHDAGTTTGGYQCTNITAIEPGDTVLFARNKAYNIKTNAANFIHGIFISPSVASGMLIARNNSFVLGTAGNPNSFSQAIRGTLFTGSLAASIILEHNTFRIGGVHVTANGNPTSVGISKTNTNAASVFTMRNNLCINTRTGTANAHVGALISSSTTGTNNIDYNTYLGSAEHAAWGSTRYETLASYKAAASPNEQHSEFGSVNFVNETDADIATNNLASLVLGTPIADVTTDIYGVSRSVTAPYRGAHEGNLVTLPVKLALFAANKSNKDVIVKWKLETGIRALATAIERSADGIHFTTAGTVEYNESGDYQFIDRSVFTRIHTALFYRLKISAIDGTFTYSGVKKIDAEKVTSLIVAVLNTPVVGNLKIKIQSASNESTVFGLRNATGAQVMNSTRLINQGSNQIELIGSSELAPGFYILTVIQKNQVQSIKFLKQ